jgi:hypothetical protein
MPRGVLSLLLMLAAAAGCSFPDYVQRDPEQAEPVGTCLDGLRNGSETAVDCGPTCDAGCDKGQGCSSGAECASGVCNAGACSVASCSDGLKDRTESDVDCGGMDGCPACEVGKLCASVADCNGGLCSSGRCQPPTCGDGLQNQDESDIDCGGSCGPCATSQHCNDSDDCALSICSQGRCQAAGCDDGLENGDETDRDCGGSCVPCANFKGCVNSDDCQSLVCNPQARICLAPTCDDGVLNADESSVDCGKSCEQKCGLTRDCDVDADCQSGACNEDRRCVPASATNQTLSTNGWLASASATFSGDTQPFRAIDGFMDTHWTNGAGQLPGMWFQIDMLKPVAFFRIDLLCTSNGDFPRSVRVLTSEDGQTFTPITGALGGEQNMHLDFGDAQIARYIRLETQQDSGGLWWRIDELRVIQ